MLLLRRFPRHSWSGSNTTMTASSSTSTASSWTRCFLGSNSLVTASRLALPSTTTAAPLHTNTGVAVSTTSQQQYSQSTRRSMLTTARQKRAMEKVVEPSSITLSSTPPPTGVPAPSAPVSTTASGGGSGGGGGMVPAAVVGLATVGAAYYYFNVYAPQVEATMKDSARGLAEEELEAAVDLAHAVMHKNDDDDSSSKKVADEESSSSSSSSEQRKLSRVVTIAIPPTMQNKAAAVAVVEEKEEEQPATGHRVLMRPSVPNNTTTTLPEEEAPDAIDQPSAVTISALEELTQATNKQAEERTLSLLASHQSLVSASAMTSDLDKLSPLQLQVRVVQLAKELQDRTKWEAVRLKEFLAMKERETADQYMQVLQKQRLEFEDILAQRLRQLQTEHYQALQTAMAQKDAQVQSVIDASLKAQSQEHEQDKEVFVNKTRAHVQAQVEKEYYEKLQAYQGQVARDLQSKVQQLEQMSQKLKQLETALVATQLNQEGSVLAHRLSAAALALSEKLQGNASATAQELHALQMAAGQDGVIATAVASLPSAATRAAASRGIFDVNDDGDENNTVGVPTVAELQTRFEENVHPECRRAVLVPKGRPGLEGQLAGMIFSYLKTSPSPDDVAPVTMVNNGDDADSSKTSSSNDQAAEYILVRARHHVRLGELENAVEELDKLQGQAAFTVADWKRDALDRIATNKALKVIKMECALLNKSLSEKAAAASSSK